jgi:hypothetical protein
MKHCKQCYKLFIPTKKEIVFCSTKCRKRLCQNRDNWTKKNHSYVLKQKNNYYLKNKDIFTKKGKLYRSHNKKQIQIRSKLYREKNHSIISKKKYIYKKKKLKNDPVFKLIETLRHRVYLAVKDKNAIKQYKYKEYIGCSRAELINHLEKQFKPGMTLRNHGKWHIDHIKPCAAFDKTDPKWELKCFHYTNLQPLWAHENIKKGDKY